MVPRQQDPQKRKRTLSMMTQQLILSVNVAVAAATIKPSLITYYNAMVLQQLWQLSNLHSQTTHYATLVVNAPLSLAYLTLVPAWWVGEKPMTP